MKQLPETGFLRLSQILGNPKAEPPIPPIIPVGKSTWWAGIQSGRFPKGVKISQRTTAWRVEDILSLIESFSLRENCDDKDSNAVSQRQIAESEDL